MNMIYLKSKAVLDGYLKCNTRRVRPGGVSHYEKRARIIATATP